MPYTDVSYVEEMQPTSDTGRFHAASDISSQRETRYDAPRIPLLQRFQDGDLEGAFAQYAFPGRVSSALIVGLCVAVPIFVLGLYWDGMPVWVRVLQMANIAVGAAMAVLLCISAFGRDLTAAPAAATSDTNGNTNDEAAAAAEQPVPWWKSPEGVARLEEGGLVAQYTVTMAIQALTMYAKYAGCVAKYGAGGCVDYVDVYLIAVLESFCVIAPARFMFVLPSVFVALVCLGLAWVMPNVHADDISPLQHATRVSLEVCVALVNLFACWYREAAIRDAFVLQQQALAEARRVEAVGSVVTDLTTKMLPAAHLKRMIASTAQVQRHIDRNKRCTVYHSDIVGFTQWSGSLAATDVVGLLGTLTLRFDAAAAVARIEKVKTVGDAYWAVSGIPDPVGDPEARVVAFALATVDLVGEVFEAFGRHKVAPRGIRVGVGTGECSGAVVGQQQISYEVFGAAHDRAGILEPLGRAQCILVCGRTVEALLKRGRTAELYVSNEVGGISDATNQPMHAAYVARAGSASAAALSAEFGDFIVDGHFAGSLAGSTNISRVPSLSGLSSHDNSGNASAIEAELAGSTPTTTPAAVAAVAHDVANALAESHHGPGTASGGVSPRDSVDRVSSGHTDRHHKRPPSLRQLAHPQQQQDTPAKATIADEIAVALADSVGPENTSGGLSPRGASMGPRVGSLDRRKSSAHTLPHSASHRGAASFTTDKWAAGVAAIGEDSEAAAVFAARLATLKAMETSLIQNRSILEALNPVTGDEATEAEFTTFAIGVEQRPYWACAVALPICLAGLLGHEAGVEQSFGPWNIAGVSVALATSLIFPVILVVAPPTSPRMVAVLLAIYYGSGGLGIVATGLVSNSLLTRNVFYLRFVFAVLKGSVFSIPAWYGAVHDLIPTAAAGAVLYAAGVSGERRTAILVEYTILLVASYFVGLICRVANQTSNRRAFVAHSASTLVAEEFERRQQLAERVMRRVVPGVVAHKVVRWYTRERSMELRDLRPFLIEYASALVMFVDLDAPRAATTGVTFGAPQEESQQLTTSGSGAQHVGVGLAALLKTHDRVDALLSADRNGEDDLFAGSQDADQLPTSPGHAESLLRSVARIVKIKSVGDTVLIAGMPDRDDGGVDAATVNAAAALVREIAANIPGRARCRAGVHVGPLVGCVLGYERLSFDVLGDTVNTASRMMSTSDGGQLSLSQAAKAVLDAAPAHIGSNMSGGGLQVAPVIRPMKGKGDMTAYVTAIAAIPADLS